MIGDVSMGDVIVRLMDLPSWKVGGCVTEDENGDFNVYINSRYGYLGQIKAVKHEFSHIKNEDLRNDLSLDLCEERANSESMI